jgi:PAS domain-containing protein
VVGFVALCHFVGQIMKDSTVSFILSAFTTPLVAIITYVAMIRKLPRIQNDLKEMIEGIDCPDACELLLRPYLLSRSPKVTKLLSKLHKNEYITKHKLLLNILDSYFTYTTLKDKTLARVKLSLIHGYSESLELDYRYYQCRKLASKDSSSETLQYLRYCKLHIDTKSQDYELCMRLKNLWSDLSNVKTPGSKVRGHIVKVRSLLKMSDLGYCKLIERFPTIPASYENYGTLLSLIHNDSSNYLAYLHNAKFLKNEFTNTSRVDALSLFHPNTGVIVIACNPKIFGRIVFCNESACDILKSSLPYIIGSSFLDLIPEKYRQNHTSLLQDLLESRKCTRIFSHSTMIYLLDSSQFLVPVKCLMRLDASGNFPCCLISFTGCTNSFEVALIDDYGHIQSNSRNFGHYISKRNRILQGRNIYTFVPRLRETHLQPIRLCNSKKVILMTHAFRSDYLNIVYAYTDKEDLEEIDLSRVCKYSTKYSIEEGKGVQIEDLIEIEASMDESKFFEASITHGDTSNSSKFVYHMEKGTDQFKAVQSIGLPMQFGSANNASFKSKSGTFEVKNKGFMTDIKKNVNRLKIVIGLLVRFM